MPNTYHELVEQTFQWPALDFDLGEQGLRFHQISLMQLVKTYGTPLKVTYLPKIGQKVDEARALFENAIKMANYPGSYWPCYCTKSSHFAFVLDEALKHGAHLETSAAYDMAILNHLAQQGKVDHNTYVLCNGFKPDNYQQPIIDFINAGYTNTIPILDNPKEFNAYQEQIKGPFNIGLRLATEEEPQFEFYTSRLGMRKEELLALYQNQIAKDPNVSLKLLHFFVNTGIRDEAYYWNELTKAVNCYCDLKTVCPELDSLDIGGGFPVPQSLDFTYDYRYMVEEIVRNIQVICKDRGIQPPHLFTEFGQYTVAESGAIVLGVIGEKQQNDAEDWYIIDNSIITSLPDAWGIGHRFILLPINRWDAPYKRVNLGGLTCDSMDYYNAEIHERQVFLPQHEPDRPLVLGFFYTGAYQETLGGYGGLHHCLIPGMQHLLIDEDKAGSLKYELFKPSQKPEEMMHLLGFEPE